MTLINDLVSVENFVKSVHSTSTTEKQTVPLSPSANSFVIRFQNDARETETAAHFRIDREFQIVYFGADAADVLSKMDALSRAFYQRKVIPRAGNETFAVTLLTEPVRYLRTNSFAFSQPFQTDNDLFACIGVLSTEVREARDRPTYEKIMSVHLRI